MLGIADAALSAVDVNIPGRASLDGREPQVYDVKNGAGASIFREPLPEKTLAIRTARMSSDQKNVTPLPDETVAFPFGELDPAVRREMSLCFRSRE